MLLQGSSALHHRQYSKWLDVSGKLSDWKRSLEPPEPSKWLPTERSDLSYISVIQQQPVLSQEHQPSGQVIYHVHGLGYNQLIATGDSFFFKKKYSSDFGTVYYLNQDNPVPNCPNSYASLHARRESIQLAGRTNCNKTNHGIRIKPNFVPE